MAGSTFKIFDVESGSEVNWGRNDFPDGQIQFYCDQGQINRGVDIICSVTDSDGFVLLDQICWTLPIRHLQVNYLYGARSDKWSTETKDVCNVASLMWSKLERVSKKAKSVRVLAPHSKLGGEARWIASDMRIDKLFPGVIELYDIVVFPDESAELRFKGHIPVDMTYFTCVKHRNQDTGEIDSSQAILPETNGKRVLVIDDLCDGGATFIKLLDRIDGATEAGLMVVHGVFSKGISQLRGEGYSRIYTTNSYDPALSLRHPEQLSVTNVWDHRIVDL